MLQPELEVERIDHLNWDWNYEVYRADGKPFPNGHKFHVGKTRAEAIGNARTDLGQDDAEDARD